MDKQEVIPAPELQARVDTFQETLRAQNIDGALITQKADLLYYAGTAQNAHVYIPAAGSPVLCVYRNLERARQESCWPAVSFMGFSKLTQLIRGAGLPLPKVLGLEQDVLPVNRFARYRQAFAEATLLDISYSIRMQRAVKSPWELARLTEAGAIYEQVWRFARDHIQVGMSEIEADSLLKAKARSLGHSGYVRMRAFGEESEGCIIAAGAFAAAGGSFDGPASGYGPMLEVPMGSSRHKIAAGEPLMIDMAVCNRGYHLDQTRILFMGEPAGEMRLAYQCSCEALERLRRALVPGRVTGDIYAEILTWVEKETPFADYFMGSPSSQVSFVGHGVGLEIDELPTISRGAKEVLAVGMVLALEPKFIFPETGVIGIEDSVVVE
ncbi:MAG: Xaa-Pro peptidase family protein, partial [Peptococcaceae bacterium]|nr:Xaa-Pro peptidase family protein [Peptococcaceae bacterium]